MSITASIEVARPVEEAVAYATNPSTILGRQQGCMKAHIDGATIRVGSKCSTVTRERRAGCL